MQKSQDEKLEIQTNNLASLLHFTQNFYLERTGREFLLSNPRARISHFPIIIEALEKVFHGDCKRLIINVPPRYGKTELIIHFVAWALAWYPESNFLYVSYSHSLAKKQTATIKQIIELPLYKFLFGVNIKDDATAKDNFELEQGGSVYAAGSGGTITGRGAGVKNCSHFAGAIIIDDIQKPDEATSDTIRTGIANWYNNTLQSRLNSPDTPIIFIGQRLHEDDLAATLLKTGEWDSVIIPALDGADNALYPEMHDAVELKKMAKKMPYEFAAQYQQDPQPAGGGIYKVVDFHLHDLEPEFICTFITGDTAETDKTYNDPTAFAFWGLYKIKHGENETDIYGLHCIDATEMYVEPKDLEAAFMSFYTKCNMHPKKPEFVTIEKKSTGVTFISILKSKYQGLRIIEIERTKASGSKTPRYLEAQPYVASRRISLPTYGSHTPMFLDHMRKITANDSHAHDDLCDCMYDAIKLALIDNTLHKKVEKKDYNKIAKAMGSHATSYDRLKKSAFSK